MRQLVALVFVCLSAVAGTTDSRGVVWIPDPHLRAALQEKLGNAQTVGDLRRLTEFSARALGITNLQGLEHATQLEELRLDNNRIGDLSPLANLKNLKDLWLPGNRIRDVSPLAHLTNLNRLFLYQNRIRDIQPLSGLVQLTGLSLYSNEIEDISPVGGMGQLEFLWLGDNRIKDLSPLSALTALPKLSLYANRIQDISALAGLMELTMLELQNNEISDCQPLSQLTALETLSLARNRIQSIGPLRNLNDLSSLNLGHNQIADVSSLSNLARLNTLDLSRNQIEDLTSVRGLGDLTRLVIQFNSLQTLSQDSTLAQLIQSKLEANDPRHGNSSANEFEVQFLELDIEQASRFNERRRGKFGRVQFPEGITELAVAPTDSPGLALHISTGQGGRERLPIGRYRIYRWSIERRDDQGNLWTLAAQGTRNTRAFEVKEGEVTALEIGEPLPATLKVSDKRSGKRAFNHTLTGQLGERIRFRRNVALWKAPSLRIVSDDRRYEEIFDFAYG